MTCKECQPLAIDLARGLPPFDIGGAVQRGDVLSHIARCKRCAQWLAEQEALSAALRAAAEADTSLSAPLSVEANVMAAWRAHQAQAHEAQAHQAQPDGTLMHGVLRPPAGEPARERRMAMARAWKPARPAWPALPVSGFAAAAAVVVLALALASVRWLNATPAADVVVGKAADASAKVADVAANTAAVAPTARDATAGNDATGSATPGKGPDGVARTRVAGTQAAVVEVLPERGRKGRPAPPRATVRRAAATRAASDLSGPAFVLLPYVEPLRPTEMRHIMRVRMSRAQLVAGETQAGGVDGATVLADVLVGEDGTARAVRIVQ